MLTLREWRKNQDPQHTTHSHLIHHGGVTVVGARGDHLRPSAEFRGPLFGFVVAWWKLVGRAKL